MTEQKKTWWSGFEKGNSKIGKMLKGRSEFWGGERRGDVVAPTQHFYTTAHHTICHCAPYSVQE